MLEGLSRMLGPRRLALSFTSWFKVPEEGMQSYELLSRASALVVTAKRPSSKVLHVVTALHIPCPFYFPNYYPKSDYPWLAAVREEHVKNTVEFRSVRAGGACLAGGAHHRVPVPAAFDWAPHRAV